MKADSTFISHWYISRIQKVEGCMGRLEVVSSKWSGICANTTREVVEVTVSLNNQPLFDASLRE